MIKRAGKHLVRKPIETPEAENSRPSSSESHGDDTTTQSREQSSPDLPSRPTPRPLECEGPGFVAAMYKMLGLFSELDKPAYTTVRCCDRCREPLQGAVDCLQKTLTLFVKALEDISTYIFGDEEAPSTQDHGISLYKPRPARNILVVSDDSDER